jgi:mono/diheme cytochrome c family protein
MIAKDIVLMAALVVAATAPPARAQTGTAVAPEGAGLFRAYCAPCHGAEGRGNGPVASSMRKQPPDLTLLSKVNGGVFPAARIRRIVEGREVASHGTREMPVWGDVFQAAKEGGTALVGARIDAILKHLESLQMKEAQ